MTPFCSLCGKLLFKPGGYEVWQCTIERFEVKQNLVGDVGRVPNMPPVAVVSCSDCAVKHRSAVAVLATPGVGKP